MSSQPAPEPLQARDGGTADQPSADAVVFRRAGAGDVAAIVRLLADDDLGRDRERVGEPVPPDYLRAFDAIDADHEHQLLVVGVWRGSVVATLQLTFSFGLSHQGSRRATVEAVRVAQELRGNGVGHELMAWAVDRARERGCRIVQLTTDKRRRDAQRFYASLGFAASHEGMTLGLP